MARPPKEGTPLVRLAVRVHPDLAAELAAEAGSRGVSLSEVMSDRLKGRTPRVPARDPHQGCTHANEKKLPYAVLCADCGKKLR